MNSQTFRQISFGLPELKVKVKFFVTNLLVQVSQSHLISLSSSSRAHYWPIMILGQFSASVFVDNKPLPEYKEVKSRMLKENSMTCWIASEAGKV